MLRKHGRFYEKVENPDTPHPVRDKDEDEESSFSRGAIEAFMRSSQLEVVVLVEGIEPATSDTIQARHSYTVDEIVWDHTFLPCLTRTSTGCTVDYSRFHKLVPDVMVEEEETKSED